MMHFSKLFCTALLSCSFVGCALVDVEKYIYKKGVDASEVRTEEKQTGERLYKKGDYDFFPRFYTLTRSYSSAYSQILIYSATLKSVYIKEVEIISSKTTYSDTIEFEKEVDLGKYSVEKKLNYSVLKLFDDKNTELQKYWSEGDIKVILRYINSAGQDDDIVFEFEFWQGKEIAWPT